MYLLVIKWSKSLTIFVYIVIGIRLNLLAFIRRKEVVLKRDLIQLVTNCSYVIKHSLIEEMITKFILYSHWLFKYNLPSMQYFLKKDTFGTYHKLLIKPYCYSKNVRDIQLDIILWYVGKDKQNKDIKK